MKSFSVIACIVLGAQILVPCLGFAQTRLVLNGGLINISADTYLVVDNPAANAITRNSGHIISESETSRIRWNIGETTGDYLMPWGVGSSNYIPLTFTKGTGTGSGYFILSTYPTPWNNSSQLPTGVSNINGTSGTDNSAYVSDRFWQINAAGYTAKPSLTNLEFTYLDAENASPNAIIENKLKAKRYNTSLNSWVDNVPSSTINTSTNRLTVASVDAGDFFPWWMLGAQSGMLYWVASSNSTSMNSANWSEASGGAGNAGVPTSDDSLVFDGASAFNCSIGSNLSVASITVAPSYGGTITQDGYSITVNNDAVFSGGSFIGGPSSIVVNGNFNVSGAAFTAPSGMLDVKGNFSVTGGSFAHNNGTVSFSGTNGTQQISSTTPVTFNNITATNTSASPGVRVQSNENLKGVLDLGTNVTFDADGSGNSAIFTLLSLADDLTQDAAIGILPSGAVVSGKVTVQRFMTKEGPGNGRIYRYISSPVQNGTVADFKQEIPINGKMYFYRESVITDIDRNGRIDKADGYIGFPSASNSETFEPGRGYTGLVPGNLLTSTSWDLRGNINAGNFSPVILPVSYTVSPSQSGDGWNLVGNPFPSAIDWNAAAGWTKANLEATVYVTDNGGPYIQYSAWNGVTGTNGGSRYIATGQGFWVKATGNGVPILQANENVKAPGVQTTFFREAMPEDLIRITMVQGAIRDEAVIHFREDATDQFDANADALKFYNGSFNLSSEQPDGKNLAINSVSPLGCTAAFKLRVESAPAGTYQLNFSEYESFNDNVQITLEDSYTATMYDVRKGAGFTFTVSADPASYGANRFRIRFSLPELRTDFLVSGGSVCRPSEATLTLDNSQKGVKYEARSIQGSVYSSVIGTGKRQTLLLQFDSLASGVNNIVIRALWDKCPSFTEKTVQIFKEKTYEVTSVVSEQICRIGTATLKAGGAPKSGYYNWYEGDRLFPFEQHDSLFVTPSLSKTTTYYVSVVNALGCEGSRTPVVVNVVQYDDAVISFGASGDELISNFKEANQWFFNDELIDGATQQTIVPQQSGLYGVEVNIDGCATRASYEFVVTGIETPAGQGISIFPNPVEKDVTITLSGALTDIVGIKIIDIKGQIVRSIEPISSSNGTYVVDMSHLPSGMYILRAKGAIRTIDLKLLKN